MSSSIHSLRDLPYLLCLLLEHAIPYLKVLDRQENRRFRGVAIHFSDQSPTWKPLVLQNHHHRDQQNFCILAK